MVPVYRSRSLVSVPVEGELDQVLGRDGKGFGRGQDFEQCFEMAGEFGLMLVNDIEKPFHRFAALLFEKAAELVGFV